MAFYLDVSSTGKKVSLSSEISIGANIGDYLELDIVLKSGFSRQALLDRSAGGFPLLIDNTNSILFRTNGGGNPRLSAPVPQDTRFKFRITKQAGTFWAFTFGGVDAGTLDANGTEYRFDTIFSDRFCGEFYSLKVSKDGGATLAHHYDPSASNGTGQILPDTVGGNDGTLVSFPTDNSQWVFYDDGGGAVTADVTESSSDFSESSSASFAANISAQVTEVSVSFSESSSATITNNLITLSVTETSQDFSESVSTSITGLLSAIVTELSQSFTESSSADISANISAVVTELAQGFEDSAQVNLIGSFTVEVTETTSDFAEACYIQLPVQRLIPRKVISVNNRSGSAIRVRRRSSVIRVR